MKLEEKTRKYLDKIKKDNKRINALLYVNDKAILEAREIDKKTKRFTR